MSFIQFANNCILLWGIFLDWALYSNYNFLLFTWSMIGIGTGLFLLELLSFYMVYDWYWNWDFNRNCFLFIWHMIGIGTGLFLLELLSFHMIYHWFWNWACNSNCFLFIWSMIGFETGLVIRIAFFSYDLWLVLELGL